MHSQCPAYTPRVGISRDSPKPEHYQESWQSCLRLCKLPGRGQIRRLKCPLSNLRCEFFPKTWLGEGARGPQEQPQYPIANSPTLHVHPVLAQPFPLIPNPRIIGDFPRPQSWLHQCPSLPSHLQISGTVKPQANLRSSEWPEAVWTWAATEGSC